MTGRVNNGGFARVWLFGWRVGCQTTGMGVLMDLAGTVEICGLGRGVRCAFTVCVCV